MRLELENLKNTHGWTITCCGKDNIKITKSKSGRCFVEMHLKCKKCGTRAFFSHWHTESYKNAQAIAAKHAKSHNHRVEGNLGIAFSYDYRDPNPNQSQQSSRSATE